MPTVGRGSAGTYLLCLLAHPELQVLAQVPLQQRDGGPCRDSLLAVVGQCSAGSIQGGNASHTWGCSLLLWVLQLNAQVWV